MRKTHLYALIENDVVINTIVADTAFILRQPGQWVEMGKIEGEKASPGFIRIEGKFVTPKPYDDWTLDNDRRWKAPVPEPQGGDHQWDPDKKKWDKIERTKK